MKKLLQIILLLAGLTWCATAKATNPSIVGTPKTNNATGSATTIAIAATSHTAGSALVVDTGAASDTITVMGVANTAGDTFHQVTGARETGNADFTDIWVAPNSKGNASDIVTVTFSATVTFRDITVFEVANADLTSPDETAAIGVATGLSVTSASFSPAGAGNLNIAEVRGPGTACATWTAGTNYTKQTSSTTVNFMTESRASAPSGAQTAAATCSVSTTSLKISVVSIKTAAAAGTFVPQIGGFLEGP